MIILQISIIKNINHRVTIIISDSYHNNSENQQINLSIQHSKSLQPDDYSNNPTIPNSEKNQLNFFNNDKINKKGAFFDFYADHLQETGAVQFSPVLQSKKFIIIILFIRRTKESASSSSSNPAR